MFQQFKNLHFYMVLATDILLFAASLFLAMLLRFNFQLEPQYLRQILTLLSVLLPVKTVIFFVFGLYRGMWRYTDLRDSWQLFKAVILSQMIAITLLSMWVRLAGFSRSVFILDALLTFVLTGGMRVAIRTMFLHMGHFSTATLLSPRIYRKRRSRLRRVLIVGAGDAGEKTLREIIDTPEIAYEVVGFLDDRKDKHNRSLHGVPVLGPVHLLRQVVRTRQVEEVLIAIPSARGTQMRQIIDACKASGLTYRTLPRLGDLINGQVTIQQFREVRYEDLLGRDPIRIHNESISSCLTNKVVLITGAGGSIGSELVRQIIRFDPGLVILVERSEAGLYAMEMELVHRHAFSNYVTVLGRVQDKVLMDRVMARYQPQVVFHAAAYKHVPLVECNPWEAVFNNVLGSQVTMDAAEKHGVERFVIVSTDKAVRPTNVMGTTKRITELLMQSRPITSTRFMAVRFGNVVGSSGSVIPLFKKQIRNGGPVTVTHPEMTRYFMTIPEACQLILQAATMGWGGEIFILKMGTPVKIADMARDLIRLSGKEPDVDIEIRYTGVRPGEKLYEELITHGEGVVKTDHSDIMVLRPEDDGEVLSPDYRPRLERQLAELLEIALEYDSSKLKRQLHAMVPEYTPQPAPCVLDDLPPNARPDALPDAPMGKRQMVATAPAATSKKQ
ncbi:nucleoside-diphosphate sugar epimerase/dehydratase [Desulfoplanes formicivorans]|uniref:Lipopolysaccharide biosynthesis protein n=1 Tax=Desulfoplanes formicivorans TaxID=1592317 RepID=A0A194AL04_9BACT|nr:nucleoside-diphosphate sugar epimerase/dehydratase [Desulfoplanes formicivorans]GAU09925.1 lipopolysaccharide biosynthesis protein [Desulfoplanes formicivorans]